MVLEMSHLMRYMLYESSKPRITLSDETAFLRNYLNLMRQRYPANAVSITSDFPVDAAARRITLPPLLFLVFIENAFKHGISYQQPSFVSVSIKMAGDTLTFNCMNSRVAHESNRPERTGIGLRNIRQRLALLDGVSVQSMSKNQRAVTRNRKIGFVFQNYNLLPKTTAIENVELPLLYNSAVSARERRERAIAALEAVGLGSRLNHKSNQMSGGQQQRVAIARALVNNPVIILADEATGNLDTRTSFSILTLFQRLYKEGKTIIFVTHNPELAQYSSRNIMLRDGRIVSDEYNDNIKSAKEAYDALPVDNE